MISKVDCIKQAAFYTLTTVSTAVEMGGEEAKHWLPSLPTECTMDVRVPVLWLCTLMQGIDIPFHPSWPLPRRVGWVPGLAVAFHQCP